MEEIKISIATEFSNRLGGRWTRLGPASGEEFYEKILLPKYEKAIQEGQPLHIYLDEVKSYPFSFLDQSFGELARIKNDPKLVSDTLCFHTENFKMVVDCIRDDIWFKK